MATLGSKLITKQMEWTANMTEQSHLGKALIAKPTKLEGTMSKLFSAQNYYSDNPLSSLLMGNKATDKEIAGTEWEWDLRGANTRPLVVLENVLPTAVTTPGLFIREFEIKFDLNWYKPGDVISPGTSNKKYQCRVQRKPRKHGSGFVYPVILMTEDTALFLPVDFLSPGQKWGKLYSVYEEAAEQSGSTQFSLPISYKNKMGKWRKTYQITDYASTEVLAVKIPDHTGKLHKSWMRFAEVEFWQQWYREIERTFWYSRSTQIIPGGNGRPVRSGPGLQEQLEDSHIHEYSILTANLIEQYLQDIFYGRVKPGAGRRIKGYTGEAGMIAFHRAIQDWQQKSGFVKNVEVYTNKIPSEIHTNALEGGYQFVKYNMANGASLELVHNPLYDDKEINFEIDEVTGFPVESQRITFLDFSNVDNEANIKIINKKDGFAFNYINGLYGPYGPADKSKFSAHSGSYYDMHIEKSCGLHIKDVTRCGELILKR